MKRFMGLVPLQVGICMWSAQFIILASIMILRLIYDEFHGTSRSNFLFILLVFMMVLTWIIAFKGCFDISLKLILVAKYMWGLFLSLWVVCTTWSLFFADLATVGFTCLNSRCTPTCYLIMFHDEWMEKKIKPNMTYAVRSKKEIPLVNNIKNDMISSYKDKNNASNTSFLTTQIAERKSQFWNVHSPVRFDDNGIIDYVYSSGLISSLKQPESNEKYVKKFHAHKDEHLANLTRATLKGTYVKVIGMPSIFLGIFIYALVTLSDYASELEDNQQRLSEWDGSREIIQNL